MPIGAQPPRRRGDIGQPYSALNLRLWLALFGLVVSTAFAILLFATGYAVLAVLLSLLALVAAIDLIVIQARRRARRRAGGRDSSLFE